MKPTLLLVCALTVATACAKEEEKQASFTAKDIAGTWAIACAPSSLGQLTAYRIATLTLSPGADFSYVHTSYQDAACTVKFYDETSTGTYSLGEAVDEQGKRVTLAATIGTATPRHEAVVTAFNAVNNCSHIDWAIDGTIDIVGTPCVGWSESNTTEAINLVEVGGALQIQVFSMSGDTETRHAGDEFIKQ